MGDSTGIQWADATENPWIGCTKMSAGCTNCYAERWDRRLLVEDRRHWGPTSPRYIKVDTAIRNLERYHRRALRTGRTFRVFLGASCDIFEDRPDLVEPRRRFWDALHRLFGADDVPHYIGMLPTKRPDIMLAHAREHGWPARVWAGVSVEDQRTADERLPLLFQVPAVVRFVSAEPLLESVDILGVDTVAAQSLGPDSLLWPADMVDWVIAGGESGPSARPAHPDWFRCIRDQCVAGGVPFFFKQHGAWREASLADGHPYPADAVRLSVQGHRLGLTDRFDPVVGDRVMVRRSRVEMKDRTLDGQLHEAWPPVDLGSLSQAPTPHRRRTGDPGSYPPFASSVLATSGPPPPPPLPARTPRHDHPTGPRRHRPRADPCRPPPSSSGRGDQAGDRHVVAGQRRPHRSRAPPEDPAR